MMDRESTAELDGAAEIASGRAGHLAAEPGPMCTLLQSLIVFCALIIAGAASAELYKWVDQNGVTNYSNSPPDSANAKKVVGIENRLSVYTPDEGFLQAVKAMRDLSVRALAMPPPPEAPPYAVVPVQPLTPYEQCLASGRVGCDSLYGEYYPSRYVPAYYPRRIAPLPRLPAGGAVPSVSHREAIPHAAQRGPVNRSAQLR
jgi:hypothetical protein